MPVWEGDSWNWLEEKTIVKESFDFKENDTASIFIIYSHHIFFKCILNDFFINRNNVQKQTMVSIIKS